MTGSSLIFLNTVSPHSIDASYILIVTSFWMTSARALRVVVGAGIVRARWPRWTDHTCRRHNTIVQKVPYQNKVPLSALVLYFAYYFERACIRSAVRSLRFYLIL